MLAATEHPGFLLIVDDDEDTRVVFRTLLTTRGHRVLEACDGDECMELVRQSTPDLIALDLRMPGPDGLTVVGMLRRDGPCMAVPVLVLTAIAEIQVHQQALAAGCDEVLVKPFSPRVLLERVERLLASSRALHRRAS
jgi:CheY-like chemotaxis protein